MQAPRCWRAGSTFEAFLEGALQGSSHATLAYARLLAQGFDAGGHATRERPRHRGRVDERRGPWMRRSFGRSAAYGPFARRLGRRAARQPCSAPVATRWCATCSGSAGRGRCRALAWASVSPPGEARDHYAPARPSCRVRRGAGAVRFTPPLTAKRAALAPSRARAGDQSAAALSHASGGARASPLFATASSFTTPWQRFRRCGPRWPCGRPCWPVGRSPYAQPARGPAHAGPSSRTRSTACGTIFLGRAASSRRWPAPGSTTGSATPFARGAYQLRLCAGGQATAHPRGAARRDALLCGRATDTHGEARDESRGRCTAAGGGARMLDAAEG